MSNHSPQDIPVGVVDPDALGPVVPEPHRGDIVVTRIRNRYRLARVSRVTPERITVQCSTPKAMERARKLAATSLAASCRRDAAHQLAQARRYERMAELIREHGLIPSNAPIALSDLPAEYVALDTDNGRSGNLDDTTRIYPPEQLCAWVDLARTRAEECLGHRLIAAEAIDALPYEQRYQYYLEITTKTVRREEIYAVA